MKYRITILKHNCYFSECPIRMTEKYFNREYINTALSFNSVMESNVKNFIRRTQYYDGNNTSVKYAFHKNQVSKFNKQRNTADICMPRHQLVRVKHAEAFSTVYLLQVFLESYIKRSKYFVKS